MISNSTICGIATPIGDGGIGIIRISGPYTFSICSKIFSKKKYTFDNIDLSKNWMNSGKARHLLHGYILDPDDKYVIDEVLLALMKGPNSYTREDVIEIQSHSGSIVLKKIMEILIDLGAQIAEPGEFTKRAFLNGRIDLAQAEAVIDLIQAKNIEALKIANSSIYGKLSHKISVIRSDLTEVISEIQGFLEFSDDVPDIYNPEKWLKIIEHILYNELMPLLDNFNAATVIRKGFKVGIIGRPNVGKSSLLNAFLNKDRAIVTDIPGTTRDVIKEELSIKGVDIFLYDTAGIHQSQDTIEKIGIKKSIDVQKTCDLILFVVEASNPFNAEDLAIYEKFTNSAILNVVNKVDLIDSNMLKKLKADSIYRPCAYVSALSKHGIDQITDTILDLAQKNIEGALENSIAPNLRQAKLIETSSKTLKQVIDDIKNNIPEDIFVIGLEEVKVALGKIIGIEIEPDILDHIFENFCIGK